MMSGKAKLSINQRNNMSKTLGVLKQIENLRTVWDDEPSKFTPWLAMPENLEILSKEIGIKLVVEERESEVGAFSVDLYATEDGSDRKVIIENQLEQSNHDHLGKIITYASGKDANVIIWIVKKAREEHRRAVEWLNQRTDENCAFFLIEIQLWQIDDSNYAPKFNVVERPNEWAKEMKNSNLSPTRMLQKKFWEGFNNFAAGHFKSLHKPQPQNWHDINVGTTDLAIRMTADTQSEVVSTFILILKKKDIFKSFESHKEEIAEILKQDVEWRMDENVIESKIIVKKPIDIKDEENWEEAFAWLVEKDILLQKVIDKYYSKKKNKKNKA